MAEANIVQDGIDRFRDAFGSIEDEIERVQKRLRTGRRRLEKQLQTNRKDIEKRVESGRKDLEKRTRRIRSELLKNPTVKRLDALRQDAAKQYEEGVETFLTALQIASKSDVQRIDRKISRLHRKLKEIENAKKPKGDAAISA